MSLGKTIIIMIVGKIGIRNDERCYDASFFDCIKLKKTFKTCMVFLLDILSLYTHCVYHYLILSNLISIIYFNYQFIKNSIIISLNSI